MATGICSPIANRVQQLASSIGLGDISFSGTLQCSQSFASAFTAGDEVMYTITDCLDCDPTAASLSGGSWEVGCALWDGTKLLRSSGTVEASSNGGALVNFTSQDLAVFHSVNGSWYQSVCATTNSLETLVQDLRNEMECNREPIGSIKVWPSNLIPPYHLLCDGSSFSVSDYPDLQAVLNSMTLPDYRGRFILGAGNGYGLNATGGSATHTLVQGEIPPHFHQQGSESLHNDFGGGAAIAGRTYPNGSIQSYRNQNTSTVGGGQPHNNMPPYRVANVIIRAAHC